MIFKKFYLALVLISLVGCSNGDTATPAIDTDGDGLSDVTETSLGLNLSDPDTDSDGILDGVDSFPNDASASSDADGDGVSDERDQFPNDPTETSDQNGDGLGDNANPFDGIVISGTVTDQASLSPLPNAEVTLELLNLFDNSNPIIITTTDVSGRFTIVAQESLLPESFVIIVSADGFAPYAAGLLSASTNLDTLVFELPDSSDLFVLIEASPVVHHLGDDSFSGTINSKFQRRTEGPTLTRSFNLSLSQASSETLTLSWVAKGIQNPNVIYINGSQVGTTANTASDGSFTDQLIDLQVGDVLVEGANSLMIESVFTDTAGDIDDFEFVILGISN